MLLEPFLAKGCPFHEKRWQLWKERGRAVIFASRWRPSQRWGEDLLTRVDLQENSDLRQNYFRLDHVHQIYFLLFLNPFI